MTVVSMGRQTLLKPCRIHFFHVIEESSQELFVKFIFNGQVGAGGLYKVSTYRLPDGWLDHKVMTGYVHYVLLHSSSFHRIANSGSLVNFDSKDTCHL